MAVVLPMVKESQTSGGTGNLTGCAAVTNYWRGDTAPSGALNRRYKYWILEGTLHEFGIGYKSAAGTFVRETILGNSSGTTAAINFTSAAVIISMDVPGLTATWSSVYSEDGDGVGLLGAWFSRPSKTNSTMSADTLYVQPIDWMGDHPMSVIGVDVITPPASAATMYMGAYAVGSNGEPGQLLCETSFAVGTGASGILTGTIGTPMMFRNVFLGYCTTQSMALRGSNSQTISVGPQLGSSGDTPYTMLSASIAAPSAMPTAPTSWTPHLAQITNPEQFAIYGG